MKLEKGTSVKIIKYGHMVEGAKGKPVDKMPQYVGKKGKIKEVGPHGYMIKFEGEIESIGWFDEEQTQAII